MLVVFHLVRIIEMKFRRRFVAVFATAILLIIIKLHLLQRLNVALFAREGVGGVGDGVGGLDDVAALIVDIWRRSANVSAVYELAADIDALKILFERASAKETTDNGNSTRRVRYLERVLTGILRAVVAIGSASSTRGVDGDKGNGRYSEAAAVATAPAARGAAAAAARRQRRLFVAERLTDLLDVGGNRIQGEKLAKHPPKYFNVFDEQPNGLVRVFVSGL